LIKSTAEGKLEWTNVTARQCSRTNVLLSTETINDEDEDEIIESFPDNIASSPSFNNVARSIKPSLFKNMVAKLRSFSLTIKNDATNDNDIEIGSSQDTFLEQNKSAEGLSLFTTKNMSMSNLKGKTLKTVLRTHLKAFKKLT
jgi:hypothetical protein